MKVVPLREAKASLSRFVDYWSVSHGRWLGQERSLGPFATSVG
jgi:hypothetical protein